MALPSLLDPVQKVVCKFGNVWNMEYVCRISVGPNSWVGVLDFRAKRVGQQIAKPDETGLWMLPCLCGATSKAMDKEDSKRSPVSLVVEEKWSDWRRS
jgi:hypothetical protein